MRILVITRNAWDDTNSIGNTMSNFFEGVQHAEFANIYFRSAMPDNKICENYFRITEKDLLKHLFSPNQIGYQFKYKNDGVKQLRKLSISREKEAISFIHRHNCKFVYRISDVLWNRKKWLNQKLDAFLEEFHPDIVFSFVKSNPQYALLIKHIKNKCSAKIILWIADDEYTVLKLQHSRSSARYLENLQSVIDAASSIFGCSEEICTYYNSVFHCKAMPLYKHCNFEYPVHEANNSPLRIVYAGNLLFGRLDVIETVIAAIKEINKGQKRIFLEIYSNTELSDGEKKRINAEDTSALFEARPYDEIKFILAKADLVMHVESFEKDEMMKTRFSFSTKIIDYLQSGSVLLAFGSDELSSIRYIKSVPGAIVVSDCDSFITAITEVLNHTDTLPLRAKAIREFAIARHSANHDWLADV